MSSAFADFYSFGIAMISGGSTTRFLTLMAKISGGCVSPEPDSAAPANTQTAVIRAWWLAAILVVVSAAACSSSSSTEPASPGLSSSTEPASPGLSSSTTEDRVDIAVAVFSERLQEDLENLEYAVNLAVETEVERCMTAEGFDYAPKTLSEIKVERSRRDTPVVAQSATRALDNLNGNPNQTPPGLEGYAQKNSAIRDKLSTDDERASWTSTRNDCRTAASNEYYNPLNLQENNWYQEVSSDARARVRADQRWVDAIDETARCYANEGYPDLPDQTNAAVAEVVEIQALAKDGAIPEDEARRRLEAIVELEARLQATFEMCELPRLSIERAIYLEYFDAIVEADQLAASIAAAEIEERMATYNSQLEEIRDQTG